MTNLRAIALLCLAVLSSPLSYAASSCGASGRSDWHVCGWSGAAAAFSVGLSADARSVATESSSSSSLPEAPDASLAAQFRGSGVRPAPSTRLRLKVRPFSAFAVMTKAGLEGTGIDVATPLAAKINLRASVSYTNLNPTLSYDGVTVEGLIRLRTAGVSVDLYPYKGSFHISPGITVYNDNHAKAVINVSGGQTFTINNTDYTSESADPIKGNFYFNMGRRIAPSLTVGWGNMLRRDSHWSVPVDIGFEYIGTPTFALSITGSACDAQDGCFAIPTDPDTQSNLRQEQADINKDISLLRFYPILSVGLSYRFGHNREMTNWR